MRTNNPEQFNTKITPANSDLIREQQADAHADEQAEIAKRVPLDKVCDIELDDIDAADCPDFCDAYISRAWLELPDANGATETFKGKFFRELTDTELDWLNDQDFRGETVQNQAVESLFSRAEAFNDGDR